jgi:DNA-binding response OmpR family regulator
MSGKPDEKKEKNEEQQAKTQPEKPLGEGKTILIADDDPGTLELLKAVLEKVKFQVLTAATGQDALTLAKDKNPNYIISDVLMPEMDGFGLFKALRKDDATSHIPILILTVRKGMEDSFMALGVEGFISKPIDTQELLNKVSGLPLRSKRISKSKEEAAGGEETKQEKK